MEYNGTWKLIYNGLIEKMYIEKDALPNKYGAILIRDLAELLSESSVSELKEIMETISFNSTNIAIGLRDLIENGTNKNVIIEEGKEDSFYTTNYIINFDSKEFIICNTTEKSGYSFSFQEIEEIGKDLVGKTEIPKGWTLTFYILNGKGRVWKNQEITNKERYLDHLNYII
jgi:hypothetical protein